MDIHKQTGFKRIIRHGVTLLLMIGCVITISASGDAANSYRTSAEAKSEMESYNAKVEAANRCTVDAKAKETSFFQEKVRLEQENSMVSSQYSALLEERDLALEELAQGLFCSKCGRSKSELERSGTDFYQHLSDVSGDPIPAAPEVVERKKQEYANKLQQLQETHAAKENRIVQLIGSAQKERIRALQCHNQAMSAREGYFRAYHWHTRLKDLEAQNKLKESMFPKPLEAKKFGLGKNMRTSEFFVQRAYLKDGNVVTLTPDTQLNPYDVVRIATHHGIDFSSRDGEAIKPMPFTAGTTGKAWVVPDSDYNTINVRDKESGNVVQYLHASKISSHIQKCSEEKPCSVWSGTQLGTTGSTGANAIHLHIQVKDKDGNYIDPDMAFLPKNSPFYSIELDVQNELKALKPTKP